MGESQSKATPYNRRKTGRKLIAIYRNAHLIYNPNAGKFQRNQGRLLQRTIETLKKSGIDVTAAPTTGPATAASIVRERIEAGADLILAAGGDGTINEALNGMVHTQVPLGILPAGTANVLACETGIGTNMERAAGALADYVPRPISLGQIKNEAQPDGRYFILMAGAGLDALIVYKIDAKLKSALGKGAYWLGGFQQFGKKLTEFEVVVNGRTYQVSFALASRVKNYGGDLSIARNASLLGDKFELVLFEGADSLPYMRYLAGVVSGTLDKMRGVHMLQTDLVQLKAAADPRAYIQVDGEHVGRMPACLRIVPKALQLLLPPAFTA